VPAADPALNVGAVTGFVAVAAVLATEAGAAEIEAAGVAATGAVTVGTVVGIAA